MRFTIDGRSATEIEAARKYMKGYAELFGCYPREFSLLEFRDLAAHPDGRAAIAEMTEFVGKVEVAPTPFVAAELTQFVGEVAHVKR